MRLNAVETRHYKADYWTFTTTQDEISGDLIPIHGFNSTIPLSMSIDASFQFAEIVTSQALQLGSQLRNILDRNNQPVLGSTYIYQVNAVAPVVNVFGYAESYRYKISRVALG